MSEEKRGPKFEMKLVTSEDGRKKYSRFGNVWRKQFDDGSELLSIQLLLDEDIKDERYEVSIEEVVRQLRAARDAGERPPYTNLEVPYKDRMAREQGGESRSVQRRKTAQVISEEDFGT